MKRLGDTPAAQQLAQGFKPEIEIVKDMPSALVRVTKRSMRRVELIEVVNQDRERKQQDIGFSSRPFVLTTMPVKRPKPGVLKHVRTNGDFDLGIIAHPDFGLPFGQDRLIPIWIASLAIRQKSRTVRFRSAAQLLDEFGLPKDGRTYRRLTEGFQRIASSAIYFGTNRTAKTRVWEWHNFHYLDSMRLWFSKDLDQPTLADEEFQNVITLSEQFWDEVKDHPIPVDLAAIRALTDSPAVMDLYVWLVWRSHTAKGPVTIPLFSETGLTKQFGSAESTKFKFRQSLKRWLARVKGCWPECPATLSRDGKNLIVLPGKAIQGRLPAAP